jgi:mitochondrial translocator assembly and maintenance protein 41
MLTRGLVKPLYYRILSKFPTNFSLCFAYGSGVKKQVGYDDVLTNNNGGVGKSLHVPTKKPLMIDLLFTVENPYQWHSQNMLKNPSHYSAMHLLGSNFVASYQESYGAKVYFNTLVPVEGEQGLLIKYGVISTKDLITDLLDWKDLYVSGRLQKPVEIIREPQSSKVQNALELNLESAVRSALLLLPQQFTEFEFYCAISNLSYNGDFRMIFGENKNKVHNIVEPQLDNFRNLYAPTVDLFKTVFEYNIDDKCRQDKSPLVILQHLNQLPKWPVRRIVREWNRGKYRMDTEDVLRAVACSPQCEDIVRKSLADIVWQSSVKQSIKNIASAGIGKSIDYSWSKALKTFNL